MDHTMVNKLDQAWRFLGHGLHVLAFVLLLVTLANDGMSWNLAAFAFVYVLGMWMRPTWLWLLLLVGTWTLLLMVAPTAAFLAFPLFFLLIGMLPMARAVPAVAVVTAVAVYALGRFNGWTIGGVIGPVTGAMVAIALGVGFRMLRRETATAERMRLAGEIHDTVAQGLSSIHMLLHSVEGRLKRLEIPAAEREILLEQISLARETAESNLEETRRIIAELQPGELVDADLPTALGAVVSTTPMGEAIQLEIDGQPHLIGESEQKDVLRIVQSLVSNVVKHSQATAARVTLTYQPDAISVDVVDNGRGMDVQHTQWSSVGMDGVRRRVKKLGGSLAIESEPGEGCGVSVHIPTHGAGAQDKGNLLWSE